MISRVAAALAVLVLTATVLVALGVGQGHPPPALPISAAAKAREIRAVRSGSATVHAGEVLFNTHGCDDCHTMAAGNYRGRLGPRLDVRSQGDSVDAIIENIEYPPDDDRGYEAGLMPENFRHRFSQRVLRLLATYVHAAASAAKSPGP